MQIEARRGQYDLAADTAVRLVRVSPEVQGRVAALTLLGRLERERGQTDAAIHAYEQVVALVGTEGPAAEELRELLSNARAGEFSRYVAALARYTESTKAPAVGVFLELAEALSENAWTATRAGARLARAPVSLRTRTTRRCARSSRARCWPPDSTSGRSRSSLACSARTSSVRTSGAR